MNNQKLKQYLNPIFQIHFNLKYIPKDLYNITFFINVGINNNSKKNNILNHLLLKLFFPKTILYIKNINSLTFSLKDFNNFYLKKFLKRKFQDNLFFTVKNIYTQLQIKILKVYFDNVESEYTFYTKYKLNINFLKLFFSII